MKDTNNRKGKEVDNYSKKEDLKAIVFPRKL